MANKQPIRDGNLRKQGDLIRRAFASGKKSVTIENIKFAIRRYDRHGVMHDLSAPEKRGTANERTIIKQNESWLIAAPADGSHVPRFCVERTGKGNGVVTRNK